MSQRRGFRHVSDNVRGPGPEDRPGRSARYEAPLKSQWRKPAAEDPPPPRSFLSEGQKAPLPPTQPARSTPATPSPRARALPDRREPPPKSAPPPPTVPGNIRT